MSEESTVLTKDKVDECMANLLENTTSLPFSWDGIDRRGFERGIVRLFMETEVGEDEN